MEFLSEYIGDAFQGILAEVPVAFYLANAGHLDIIQLDRKDVFLRVSQSKLPPC